MKSPLEAVLDRLEGLFTKPRSRWADKPPPDWVVWMSPDYPLEPSDRYSFRLYVRTATAPLLITFPLIAAAYGAAVATDWPTIRKIYAFLKVPHPTGQSHHFVMLIYSLTFFLVVGLPIFLAAMTFAGAYPSYYFWNRRAARLQAEAVTQEVAPVGDNVSVLTWPPAPKRPN